jgi:hypothetical protein
MVDAMVHPAGVVRIGVVGKYSGIAGCLQIHP